MIEKGFVVFFGELEPGEWYLTIDGKEILLGDLTAEHVHQILRRGMHGLSETPFGVVVKDFPI